MSADDATVTRGPWGYYVAVRNGHTVGIAEQNGQTWDVYRTGVPTQDDEPFAKGVDQAYALELLRTMPARPTITAPRETPHA